MKTSTIAALLLLGLCQPVRSQEELPDTRNRITGMLLGSLYGDALGGPVEFKPNQELAQWLPDLRTWSADRFGKELASGELAKRLQLLPYKGIRPAVAPYGPWEPNAAAGTVTDDSRHKIIVMQCLTKVAKSTASATAKDLSQAYLDFARLPAVAANSKYVALAEESFREYQSAARWLLGERDLEKAFPPDRIWVGISNCSGQMALPPVAGLYPAEPDAAYRAAYSLDFIDTGGAKDISAALVAGLAQAIGSEKKNSQERWNEVFEAIRSTDPYRYADVPFAERPATEWLDFAVRASERANGSPLELFRILEKEGRPKYYWDAHFAYACAIAFLHFCDFQPQEALVVSLAFGHDTDSAAQVIGALAGAVHGTRTFPANDLEHVQNRLLKDYAQDVQAWVDVLITLQDRNRYPFPIRYLEAQKK